MTRQKTHKQNFWHPPSPGTIPQICFYVYVCVFFPWVPKKAQQPLTPCLHGWESPPSPEASSGRRTRVVCLFLSPHLEMVEAFVTGGCWKAERCRNASWRNFQFFGIIFTSRKGMLRGFHPCHIGTLDFCSVPRWIFWLNFLEAVFWWHLLLLLQKNTHRKFGEKFGGKIRWKHSVFRCVFRCVFRYAFRCVFRWAAFGLEIGKIRTESVLQERPFKGLPNLTQEGLSTHPAPLVTWRKVEVFFSRCR